MEVSVVALTLFLTLTLTRMEVSVVAIRLGKLIVTWGGSSSVEGPARALVAIGLGQGQVRLIDKTLLPRGHTSHMRKWRAPHV
jgi:hypothetical protein